MRAESLQPCPILGDPMDCSPAGSSVHRILQARTLQWVAITFSRDLPNQGIKPESLMSLALTGGLFTTSATWKAHLPHNLREILENWGGKRSFFFLIWFLFMLSWGSFRGLFLFCFLFWPHKMWEFSSLTRDGNCTHCTGSKE